MLLVPFLNVDIIYHPCHISFVAIVETESTRKIYEFCKDAQENIDEQ